MSDIGSPLDYYTRVFGNFELSVSGVFALNHAVAFIGMITGIFLTGLALFIFRSGSNDLKNQAIGMILLIEGFMAQTGDIQYGKKGDFNSGRVGTGSSDLADLDEEFNDTRIDAYTQAYREVVDKKY